MSKLEEKLAAAAPFIELGVSLLERAIDFVSDQIAHAAAEEKELLEAREKAWGLVEEKLAGVRQRHEGRLAEHRRRLRERFPG